jgi:hypothetical protein
MPDETGTKAGSAEQAGRDQAVGDIEKMIAGPSATSPGEAKADGGKAGEKAPVTDTATGAGEGGTKSSEGPEAKSATLSKKQAEAVKRAGLDPKEIEALGQTGVRIAETLTKGRSDADRLASRLGNLEAKLESLAKGAPGKAASETPPDEGSAGGAAEGGEDELPEISAGDLDEPSDVLVGKLGRLRQVILDLRKALSPDVLEFIREKASELEDGETAEADEDFTQLAKAGWDMFGEGPIGDLEAESSEVEARNAVVDLADRIRQACRKRGEKMTFAEARRAARAQLYPKQFADAATRKAEQDIARRRRGTPEGASARTGAAAGKTPKDQAIDEIETLIRAGA